MGMHTKWLNFNRWGRNFQSKVNVKYCISKVIFLPVLHGRILMNVLAQNPAKNAISCEHCFWRNHKRKLLRMGGTHTSRSTLFNLAFLKKHCKFLKNIQTQNFVIMRAFLSCCCVWFPHFASSGSCAGPLSVPSCMDFANFCAEDWVCQNCLKVWMLSSKPQTACTWGERRRFIMQKELKFKIPEMAIGHLWVFARIVVRVWKSAQHTLTGTVLSHRVNTREYV